jgi:hypothetical protein
MLQTKVAAPVEQFLIDGEIRNTMGVLESQFTNQRVLVLIPDHTRSLPLPFLFCALVDVLEDVKTIGLHDGAGDASTIA